jgi:hypothetical protein
MLSNTAQKAIAAYGGEDLWKNASKIEMEVSVNGLAFFLKRRVPFNRSILTLDVQKPYARLLPIGKDPQIAGVLDGGNVRLEDTDGNIIDERKEARSYFTFGRRFFWWDDLDMAYFANYAFWNYYTLPNLLLNEKIVWTEITDGVLQAQFPDTIPTHNKIQTFYFDADTGLLRQHNYTVDIISPLATAANVVVSHEKSGSSIFAAKRVVSPMGFNKKSIGFPVLIAIKVHNYHLS